MNSQVQSQNALQLPSQNALPATSPFNPFLPFDSREAVLNIHSEFNKFLNSVTGSHQIYLLASERQSIQILDANIGFLLNSLTTTKGL
jgi:hypothetical protein